jgi:hypothetical protein
MTLFGGNQAIRSDMKYTLLEIGRTNGPGLIGHDREAVRTSYQAGCRTRGKQCDNRPGFHPFGVASIARIQ